MAFQEEHGGVTKTERLAQLQAMRKSRVDMQGKTLSGFKRNVELLDSEIARLQSEIAAGAE